MTIKASEVKLLREKTGLGMMECKNALVESKGDIELAITNLRKNSALKAEKKSSRTAAEGRIISKIDSSENLAVILEVNCETDFVAKDDSFIEFCEEALDFCLQNPDSSLAQLSEEKLEEKRQALIQKIGENIVVRRREIIKSDNLYSYVHGNNKIGSIVSIDQENKNTGEDIAMHIAASSPLVIDPNDLDETLVTKEEEIIKAQVADSDKPENIVEKMVLGRLEKFKSEVSLLNQPFVKDPSKNIKTLLEEQNLNVLNFHRYELGEGIEVNKIDFAEEVKSQLEN
ncbi:MAG: elongation factor Ts [Gammaproteobacteria bacterium]|jgi:elongation factor Ts|nr:elongation factor Ts [Gammaproteobacteria bacterium]